MYEALGQYYAEKFAWGCERCGKRFFSRNECQRHEKNCRIVRMGYNNQCWKCASRIGDHCTITLTRIDKIDMFEKCNLR